MDKTFSHLHPSINKSNCSVSFTAHGPTTITSGTGDYAGISGTVKISITFAGIAPKKANGTCNLADNAPTYGGFSAIIGSRTSVRRWSQASGSRKNAVTLIRMMLNSAVNSSGWTCR